MQAVRSAERPLAVLAVLCLAFLGACNCDDNPASPGGAGGTPDDPFAAMGLRTREFGAMVTTMLPAWWSGDLSGITKSPPVWDAQTMSWGFSIEVWDEGVSYPSSAGVLAWFQLQYLAGETPQQGAEGAAGRRLPLGHLHHGARRDERRGDLRRHRHRGLELHPAERAPGQRQRDDRLRDVGATGAPCPGQPRRADR